MPPLVWATVEAALHAWVVAGTGLSASAVLWAQQAAPQGAGTYAAIRVMQIQRRGMDWVDLNSGATAQLVRGTRTALVMVQVFGGGHRGTTSPLARLEGVVSAACIPTRRDALRAAGIGIAELGPVQSIDGIVGSSTFEPRATIEIRLNLAAEVSETPALSTYIGSTEIEGTDPDDTVIIPEFEVP